MTSILLRFGQGSGLIGLVLIVASAIFRLAGHFTLGSFATSTLLLAGISAVSGGCFLLLWVLVEQGRR